MLEYLPRRNRVGGLRLDARKQQSTAGPLRQYFIPDRLIVPVEPAAGTAPEICVTSDQRVLRGQPIAVGNSAAPSVHAPTSGRVADIEMHEVVTGGRLVRCPCVAIDTDGLDETYREPDDLGVESDLDRVHKAGIVGLGGAGYSTARKIAATPSCRTLVINGAECEPYISCDDILMRERAADVVAGSVALCGLVGATECIIAIERDKPLAIQAIKSAARSASDPRLRVAEIPSIYPAGGERQLIDLLTAHEVPSGQFPSASGILCQNVGTAYAVHRALNAREPVVSRIVTVTGAGVAEPRNIETLIGTPIAELIAHCGGYTDAASRLIVGGSMMGISLASDATPVSKSTNCVIVASSAELPAPHAEWPCIRCGECALVCPAYLLPQILLAAARVDAHGRLTRAGLADCIECGCCDAVCPSQIRLTETFRAAKTALEREDTRAARAAAAHRRFSSHSQRIAEQADASRAAQSHLLSQLGDDDTQRARSIHAAVERAKAKRRPSGDAP